MLRVVIVDDEALARRGMRRLLAAHPAVDVVGEAASVKTAAELIRIEKPDAVFLDIEMRGDTGFDLVSGLDDPPDIVFVTAYDHYAVKAYDVSALDYLLKPVDPARLGAAVARLEKARTARQALRRGSAPVLHVKTNAKTVLVRIGAVVAMQAEGDYTRIFAANAPPLLAGQSLGKFEAQMPQPPFLRISRSLMVNIDRLVEIETIDRDTTRIGLDGCAESFVVGRIVAAKVKKATDRSHMLQTRSGPARTETPRLRWSLPRHLR
ncbi:MAG: response regulator transcription factor [Rhodoplanes sp.]|uniref:LytR/AlgR family response regulator transcription factor n=1 Tax=Rhodoplanes sp. TaxID=1968906 RepID=UPI0018207EE6|nr:LytTR family DNA-binding domain-containing protein [Rhodoplanes sp.]NVO14549.1 response regulator transcription factor [Rhodoplanes sp.]